MSTIGGVATIPVRHGSVVSDSAARTHGWRHDAAAGVRAMVPWLPASFAVGVDLISRSGGDGRRVGPFGWLLHALLMLIPAKQALDSARQRMDRRCGTKLAEGADAWRHRQ
jgi:hypothetical protein